MYPWVWRNYDLYSCCGQHVWGSLNSMWLETTGMGLVIIIGRVFEKRTWTNRLVLGSLPGQLIGYTHKVGRYDILMKTNWFIQSYNRLYFLSVLKKMKFCKNQSIDIRFKSNAWTYWLRKLEICSAVNWLTLSINRLILCFLWKMELWDRPIDWAFLTNRLAHA